MSMPGAATAYSTTTAIVGGSAFSLASLDVLCSETTTSSTSHPLQPERDLVAWILLSGLSTTDLEHVWETHGTYWTRVATLFLEKTLQQVEEKHDGDGSSSCLFRCYYLALISMVTSRLPASLYPLSLAPLIYKTWQAWLHQDSKNYPPPIWLHCHVVASLDISIEAVMLHEEEEDEEMEGISTTDLLQQIWVLYTTNPVDSSKQVDESKNISNENTASTNENEEGNDDKDWQALFSVLHHVLLQPLLLETPPKEGEEEASCIYRNFSDVVLNLFVKASVDDIPISMVPHLLEWLAQEDTISSTCMGGNQEDEQRRTKKQDLLLWNEWFLGWFTQQLQGNRRQGMHHPILRILMETPRGILRLQSWLMAHVTSAGQEDGVADHQALRAMAWQALLALVETNGWDWMLLEEEGSHGRLGAASRLCTWIRLAAGEWRIQLQASLASSEHSNAMSTVNPPTLHDPNAMHSPSGNLTLGTCQATALPIGHGCARVIQSVVPFCIQSQRLVTMPSTGGALLHLRQSLEQSLWTTIEYLSMVAEQQPSDLPFYSIALPLLGTLLMEMDIFELLQQPDVADPEGSADASPADTILECLQALLPMAEDTCLLPGLVHLLSSSENLERQSRVRTYLHDPLTEYLDWCWQRDVVDDSIAWTCSCTELWVQLSAPQTESSGDDDEEEDPHRRICLSVLGWMQQALMQPAARNYMARALGCYMTLSKDCPVPPKEHESRIIVRALQWANLGPPPG
eukprot:Nitzschia sp. Nitz4//scaffold28_size193895//65426//67654//NITZ4_001646-RA/size193895-processed-gene-0.258-mRNA-1//-1//CDS//3329545925//2292//frame0